MPLEHLPVTDEEGNKRLYRDGRLHRDGDPPAFVSVNGDKA